MRVWKNLFGTGGEDTIHPDEIANGVLGKVVKYYGSRPGTNADEILDSVFLIGTAHTHSAPMNGAAFTWIIQIFYQSVSATSNRLQIAFGYGQDAMAFRRYEGEWKPWAKVL